MTMRYLLVAVSGACCAAVGFPTRAAAQPTEFTVGHVFISVTASEGCQFGEEAIIEVDPTTGTWTVFADSSDGFCGLSGLRFTPDGKRLLALSGQPFTPADPGLVIAFNADGTGEVILDGSDGVKGPVGSNALAFDFRGDLYVLNTTGGTKILRYPGGTGPGVLFAGGTSGISGRGALDFAPNGDLFYCGNGPDAVIRISPQGQGTVFDSLFSPLSLAFDRGGNLFVSDGLNVFRYDNGDAGARRVLATGFDGPGDLALPIALSPDGGVVYVAEFEVLYRVDANDGTKTVVANWSTLNMGLPRGMTVFDPAPRPLPPWVPTVSSWGLVLTCLMLAAAGTILIRRDSVKP